MSRIKKRRERTGKGGGKKIMRRIKMEKRMGKSGEDKTNEEQNKNGGKELEKEDVRK